MLLRDGLFAFASAMQTAVVPACPGAHIGSPPVAKPASTPAPRLNKAPASGKLFRPAVKVTAQKVDKDLGCALCLSVKATLADMEQMLPVIGRKTPLEKKYGNSMTSRRDL